MTDSRDEAMQRTVRAQPFTAEVYTAVAATTPDTLRKRRHAPPLDVHIGGVFDSPCPTDTRHGRSMPDKLI